MAEGGDSAIAGVAGRAETPCGVAESLGVTAIAGAAKTRGVAEADAAVTGAGSAGVAGMTGRGVVETLGIAGRAETPCGVAESLGVTAIAGAAKPRGVAEADAAVTGAGSAGVAGMTGRGVETLGIAGRAETPLGVGVAVAAGAVDITGIAKAAEGVIGITGVIEEL